MYKNNMPLLEEAIQHLGKVPDRHIARIYNVPSYVVKQKRLELGIGKCKEHLIVCGPRIGSDVFETKLLPRLGKEPDISLGKEFGLSRERIRQYRRDFNIPKFKKEHTKGLEKQKAIQARKQQREEVYNQLLPFLGKASDNAIGRTFEIHPARITFIRKSFGIPPFKEKWQHILTPAQELTLCTDAPNMTRAQLAAKYNLKQATMDLYLTRLGLVCKYGGKRKIKDQCNWKVYLSLLGTMPDSKLAKQFGISPGTVCATRRRRNIKAYTKS